jgi:hypothetical protein
MTIVEYRKRKKSETAVIIEFSKKLTVFLGRMDGSKLHPNSILAPLQY